MTTPTNNAVPSNAPNDLLFNAEKLDEVVSGTGQYYTDRKGVNRRTLAGIDSAADSVLNSIGYAVPVTYAAGISLTLTSQTVEYNGVVYAPKSANLPFTTSGAFETAKFRAVQVTDAALITCTQAGTGAVASTVQDELRRWVWVDQYGADPTGATDCTTAIQDALNTGKDVRFTKGGTYKAQAATLNLTTARQTVFLMGVLLKVSDININADNVTIDLGGGEIRGPVKVGQLAATGVAGTNTLTLVDASEFVPGDILASSYGDNGTNWPLNGQTGIAIQSINYTTNVVTLVSNLLGTVNIPSGTYVGNFVWGALIGINASKNVVFSNGLMTRANGYFLSSWRWNQADFLTNIPTVRFENVEFRDNAYDHFIFVRTKADFINCTIGKCFDVAKQGIVYGDNAQIYMERCRIARGNFDLDFAAISDAGRSTYFQGTTGYIRCVDCYFDGTNKLPSAAYFNQNSLHCIQWGSGGANHSGSGGVPGIAAFTEYSFERCEFYNYTRSLFSTTYATDSNSLYADRVTFNNCQIGTNPFHIRTDFANGKQALIKTFAFNNCNIYTTGANSFSEAFPNSVFQAVFTDCYLKILNSDQNAQACKFVRGVLDVTPLLLADDRCEFVDLTLRGSKVKTATTSSYVPVKGTFIVDDANFAAHADGALTAFVELGQVSGYYGQSNGVTVRSKNGSITYDVTRFNNDTWPISNINETWDGVIYGLFGDDWMLGLGARVKSFNGGYYKSTYTLKVKLQGAASGGTTSVVVNTISYAGNQPAVGDHIFIKLDNGQVFVTKVASGYTNTTTIPLTTALPSAAAADNGVSFLRLVAL